MNSADRALARRDGDLAALEVLLDDGALGGWLGEHAPGTRLHRRTYLRYKPGTSAVLGLQLDGPTGSCPAVVLLASTAASVKLDKVRHRAPHGSVLAWDPAARLLLVDPRADRDLPALARLADPDRRDRWLAGVLPDTDPRGAAVQTLSHKPQRRWVGLLTPVTGPPVLLRAHRPPTARATARALAALTGGTPAVPRWLGIEPRVGLVVVEHVPGRPVDGLPGQDDDGQQLLVRTGEALAALHTRSAPGLRRRRPARSGDAVRAAATALGGLLPDLADRAHAVADAAAGQLAGQLVAPVPCHGDFSLDQVVRTPDGSIALIDLDEAGLDDPAGDLACAAAAAQVHHPALASSIASAVAAGYARHRELPAAPMLAAHTAGHLLRRAVEPFRSARPDWPHQASRLLGAAEEALP